MTAASGPGRTIRPLRRRSRAVAFVVATATVLAAAGCGSAGTGGHGQSAAHVASVSGGHGQSVAHAASVSGGSAPSCLPATLEHSARLAGVPVDVSPAPGTDTADSHTQISFLGVPAAQIQVTSVVGAHSGRHQGRLEAYGQGDGASFVPDTAFATGEQVTVHAVIGAGSAGKEVAFAFRVDTPWSTAGVAGFPNPTPGPSDYQSFVTVPGMQAPTLTVTVPDRDPAAGDIFMSNGPGPGRYGPLIYTPQGQLVWFDQLSNGIAADDLSVQTYQGQRDLTFWQGRVLALGYGQGEDVVMNSSYRTVATVKGGNGLQPDLHDFQIAQNDVAYVTAYNPIRCDLSSQQGPRNGVILDAAVEEIDIRTGLVRWEWHSLDHIGVSESQTSPPSTRAWDWFHIDSIDPEPDGNVLISARNTWAIYQIESGTGNVLWRLGGLKSSFKMGAGTKTAWQHDARMLSNGDVTIFDDGSDPPVESQSRAVRIALDLKARSARLVSSYTHPSPPLLAASQGNMQTLANGNTVVGYGGVPELSEYGTDGSLLFDAHLPFDQLYYRAFRIPWSGRPLTPPAVVASLNNTSEETIVHMSWNGATDVASWRVMAGTHSGSLAPAATIGSEGFESSTILAKRYAYVAVQALDSSGHALGTSHTVSVKSYASSFPSGRRS